MKHHNTPCGQAHRPPRPRLRGPGAALALAALAAPALLAAFFAPPATAKDTDIYKAENIKHNAYFSVDNSGSMMRPIYEHSIDWAALYDDFMTRNDLSIAQVRAQFPDKEANLKQGLTSKSFGEYIADSSNTDEFGVRGRDLIANGPDDEHGLHYERDRIYLVRVMLGINIVQGKAIYSDFAQGYQWRVKQLDKNNTKARQTGKWEDVLIAKDMQARLDANGNLVFEPGSPLSKGLNPDDPNDTTEHILFNGKILPVGGDLPEHEYKPLKNGMKLDNGFAGYLQAPGWVSSGYWKMPGGLTDPPYTGTDSSNVRATQAAMDMWRKARCEVIECDASYEPKKDSGDNRIPKLATPKDYQDWADLRFRRNVTLNWRDWKGGAYVDNGWAGGSGGNMRRSVWNWTTKDWANFIAHLNYSTRLKVLNEQGQEKANGDNLMGSWAYNWYTNNSMNGAPSTGDVLPEKNLWVINQTEWETLPSGDGHVYMFVTGNFLNFCQALSLRYIDSPSLAGETLKYPYPEDHTTENASRHNGADYYMYDKHKHFSAEEPHAKPRFNIYIVDNGQMKIKAGKSEDNRDWSAYAASACPLFYEGYPNRGDYRLQNREDALREALTYVIDNYGDKMNWGFARYFNTGRPGSGERVEEPIDLTAADQTEQNKKIRKRIWDMYASGGTPMANQLQKVWHNGFYKPYTEGKLGREEDCGKYFLISLTDGMANGDNDTVNSSTDSTYPCLPAQFHDMNSLHVGKCYANEEKKTLPVFIPSDAPIHPNYNGRKPPSYAKDPSTCSAEVIGRKVYPLSDWSTLKGFQNWDCDGWRNGDGNLNLNVASLYDDIAEYMYTHSFKTGEEICNPHDSDPSKAAECRADLKSSKDNVKSHHIAFGTQVDMMKDAAESAGGRYFVVSNKEQLIAVFEDLAMEMSGAVSFNAPTISTDSSSLDSGNDAYSGLFLARDDAPWAGNIKWYKRGSVDRDQDPFAFYGKNANGDYVKATDSDGVFTEVDDWWSTGDDAGADNLAYAATNADIVKGGVGWALLKAVQRHFDEKNYYQRKIYTCALTKDGDYGEVLDSNGKACKGPLVELQYAFRKGGQPDAEFDEEVINKHLGPITVAEARNIINYTYGYEYDADAEGAPTKVRDWILGAIVHSRPVTIEYYAYDEVDEPYQRLVAVGANDGMLHVFDATDCDPAKSSSTAICESGKELFAFIPTDVLPLLKNMPTEGAYVESVDGELTLYRQGDPPRQPKYLLFGLRNGGSSYWALDIAMDELVAWKDKPWHPFASEGAGDLRWKMAWVFRHEEIATSWSKPQTARIPITVGTGATSKPDDFQYKDVVIFTGGYDPVEDNFPEPFTDNAGPEDQQKTGTPFNTKTDELIAEKWKAAYQEDGKTCKNEPTPDDVNGNCKYDIWNKDGVTSDPTLTGTMRTGPGRSVFVLDIDDPDAVTDATYEKPVKTSWIAEKESFQDYTTTTETVLPFKLTYGATSGRTGAQWTRDDMKWCFPASPSTALYTDVFVTTKENRTTKVLEEQVTTRTSVLSMLYAPDIYGNIFKARYNVAFVNRGSYDKPEWHLQGEGWEVRKVFSANPGTGPETGTNTDNRSAHAGEEGSLVDGDVGRKVFYPPTISFGGTVDLFDAANFNNVVTQEKDAQSGETTEDAKVILGRDGIATLFFGTGDREHPNYTMVHNRIYSVYDDSSLYALENGVVHDISSINLNARAETTYTAYDERDLLNLTCDELGTDFSQPDAIMDDNDDFNSWLMAEYGEDTNGDEIKDKVDLSEVIDSLAGGDRRAEFEDWLEEERKPWLYVCNEKDSDTECLQKQDDLEAAVQDTLLARDYLAKQYLRAYLTDDPLDAYDELKAKLEIAGEKDVFGKRGTENDRKGWYIKLDRQGTSDCANMLPAGSVDADQIGDRDNHRGEAVLAPLTLYHGILYATTYQPVPGEKCAASNGNAFNYAIDYGTGKAPYNYNTSSAGLDYTDRYTKYTEVPGLPSGVDFIFEGDAVVPMVQLGDKIAGFAEAVPPGETCTGNDCQPGMGGVSSPSPGLELYYWRDSNSQVVDE